MQWEAIGGVYKRGTGCGLHFFKGPSGFGGEKAPRQAVGMGKAGAGTTFSLLRFRFPLSSTSSTISRRPPGPGQAFPSHSSIAVVVFFYTFTVFT